MKIVERMLLVAGLLAAQPASAVVLNGTVTRSDSGAPLGDAMVLVRSTGLYVQTNAAGVYSIPGIPAGVYGLSCSAPGLSGVSTGSVDLTADATHDFSLAPPVAGSVTAGGTSSCAGVACAGVLVQGRQNGQVLASAVSGPGGAYQLPGLAEGAWDIRGIRLEHLVDEQLGVGVSLAAPPVVALDLASAPGRVSLRGRVGLNDNPLDKSGSTVRVYGQNPAVSTVTDPGGGYTLAAVPTGLLSISATHPGYTWHHRLDVLVQSDRDLDFVLAVQGGPTDPTYRVNGFVRLRPSDGSDPFVAAGSRVSVFRTDADLVRTGSTDAEGRYSFSGLPAGNYQAAAAREGYRSQLVEPFDLGANRAQDFELEPDPDYDWGPGANDGELGCGCASGQQPAGTLALGLIGLLGLVRRRRAG